MDEYKAEKDISQIIVMDLIGHIWSDSPIQRPHIQLD